MSRSLLVGALVPLPFQVRPRSGEGARLFLIRLAEANHLKPFYLRKCLTEPPLHRGAPAWDRIAAVTGRDPIQLRQILETIECAECGTPIRPASSFGSLPRTCSTACRQKRYRKGVTDWEKILCRVCGKLFRVRLGQRRHLCSSHCRRMAFDFQRRGEPLPRRAAATAFTNEDPLAGLCPVCGSRLGPPAGRRACSRRCSHRVTQWIKNPLPPPTSCGQCGGPVLPRADGRPRTWCSKECWNQTLRERHRPVNAQDPVVKGASTTAACRGCGRRYRPLKSNPWCSVSCFDQHLARCRNQCECGACGTSTAHLRVTKPARNWCSSACRQRATRWRAEIRDRASQAPR